jgi:hypothetical protein
VASPLTIGWTLGSGYGSNASYAFFGEWNYQMTQQQVKSICSLRKPFKQVAIWAVA